MQNILKKWLCSIITTLLLTTSFAQVSGNISARAAPKKNLPVFLGPPIRLTPPDPITAVINVGDYGAVPNGQVDSTAAINAAIKAAVDLPNKPVTVQFEAGTYLLSCTGYTNVPCINLNGVSIAATAGINIQGSVEGTQLLIGNPNSGGIQVQNASGINISNLIVDYITPPFTQGRITGVFSQSFDFQADSNMPEIPDALCSLYGTSNVSDTFGYYTSESFGTIMQVSNPRNILPGGPNGSMVMLSSCQKISPMTWRLGTTADALSFMNIGTPYVQLIGRHWTKNGIAVFSSKDVAIQNVEIRAAGGVAVLFTLSEGQLRVNNLRVTFPPGSNRFLTTDADGVHAQHNWGSLTIENSFFEGMADDGTNNYTPASGVAAIYSPTLIQARLEREIRVGDWIEIQGQGYVMRGGATVLSITPRQDNPYYAYITLSQPIYGVTTDDAIFDTSAAGPYSVYRNNTFGRHRGRSLVTHSVGGMIDGNTFNDVATMAIDLSPLWDWHEGPSAHDLTIQNNIFKGGDSAPWLIIGQISVRGGATGITIKDNMFYNSPRINIDVDSSYLINILNSQIFADWSNPRWLPGGTIDIQKSNTVTVNGMTVQDSRSNTQPPYVTVKDSINVTIIGVPDGSVVPPPVQCPRCYTPRPKPK